MKKNFTRLMTLGLAFAPIGLAAQVNVSTTPENRKAVVEEFTGIYCGYCPIGHVTVQQQMTANPGNVVAMNVHAGGYAVPSGGDPDFRTTDGNTLDGAFQGGGYPNATLNRSTITYVEQGNTSPTTDDTYHPAYLGDTEFIPSILTQSSPVNLHITADVDVQTRMLTVDVEYYYTGNAANATNYLSIGLLQNNMEGPQTDYGNYNPNGWVDQAAGIYNHQHVFRGWVGTGAWGEAITSTSMGSTGIITKTMTLPATIGTEMVELGDLEIVAFIAEAQQADITTGISEYPTFSNFASNDEVALVSVSSESGFCAGGGSATVNPEIVLQNNGGAPMTSATITYDVNGGTSQTFNWTGNLGSLASETVTLNAYTFSITGSDVLNVTVSDPNGTADITTDNSGTFSIATATSGVTSDQITVHVQTDSYSADENNSWTIRDGSGAVVATHTYSVAEESQANVHVVNLPQGSDCFTIEMSDDYGDGNGWQNNVGWSVKNHAGQTIISGPADWGSSYEEKFEMNVVTDVEEQEIVSEFKVYPNPAQGEANVSFNVSEVADVAIKVTNVMGQTVETINLANVAGSQVVALDTDVLSNGVYYVNAVVNGKVITKKLTVQK